MTKDYLNKLTTKYPLLSSIADAIKAATDLLLSCTKAGNTIFTCGNGGSAADAEHIVGELLKGFRLKRKLSSKQIEQINKLYPTEADYFAKNLQQAIPAVSLVSDVSFSTAFSNDMNPDFVFAQQIFGLGKKGDVLIAISTSGNSVNVIHAAKIARVKGLKVVGMTGRESGLLGQYADVIINVPAIDVADIQEFHLPIYHCICSLLEQELFAV